ncbi:deoxyribodipyrimidine photo-lyase [Rhodobacteraceae bacterium CCMM004]|nr:deoxyribodipyrimidine photo-lyase [Rhodobacteraceae bacterium CCMM004]
MDPTPPPILLWVRRDLRLADHPALAAAAETGRPVIPVYLHDDAVAQLGACPRWRLGLGIAAFARSLEDLGARLILRRGPAPEALAALAEETGATDVWWTRAYDPDGASRDAAVADALGARGVATRAHPGHLLFDPEAVSTGSGGPYKVYTPFWRAVKDRDVPAPLSAPRRLAAPTSWPDSDRLDDWAMGAAMNRGAVVVAPHATVGAEAAEARLDRFVAERIGAYAEARNMLAIDGTSRLSENLTYGEISVRTCWHAGMRARAEGAAGAETFLKELVWRDFAHHLAHRTPRLLDRNWREDWDGFPWREDADAPEVRRWRQGRTGVPVVDAAMREMFVTGHMHNRARMIVASYLTKHLLFHWRIGQAWFDDCLIDWDPASNALGWQWTAGSGPDAAPFFRIFNPETQAEKFDPEGRYRARWLAEGQADPPTTALSYFDAVPRSWGLSPDDPYPDPAVNLREGRQRALAAYEAHRGSG